MKNTRIRPNSSEEERKYAKLQLAASTIQVYYSAYCGIDTIGCVTTIRRSFRLNASFEHGSWGNSADSIGGNME